MSNEVVVIVRAPGIDGVFHLPIEHLNELLDWLVAHRLNPQTQEQTE